MPSGELVNILLFADDIIIRSSSSDDLLILKGVLEQWCQDFIMTVSTSKSKIISPSYDLVFVLPDLNTVESDILELVSQLQISWSYSA